MSEVMYNSQDKYIKRKQHNCFA